MIETMTLHQASKYLRDKGLSLCSDTLATAWSRACTPLACASVPTAAVYFRFSKRSWMRGSRA